MSAYDSDEAFDRLMDDLQVIYGLKVGHVATQNDVDALNRLDAHWQSEGERATEAYHRGFQHGVEHSAGVKVRDLVEKLGDARTALTVERALSGFHRARVTEWLEPFAAAAKRLSSKFGDDTPVDLTIQGARFYTLALGSLRAARTAHDAATADARPVDAQ